MTENTPMLSAKNIVCGYQNTEILHGISFDVFSKEKLCILGPNGSGKTTLLRALCRLLPFQGELTVCGQNALRLKRPELAKKIAYMSQMNAVYFSYTVYETVLLGRYPHHRGAFSRIEEKDREIVKNSLKQTGTWEVKDKYLTELSGGQLQRVMLARVFAQTPDIILLDEPTNHLDLKYQVELLSYLNEWIKEENRCVISVFHDLNMAFSFADRILLLEEGNCAACAPADDFPIERINQIYGIDVSNYMQNSLRFWEKKENRHE